MDINNIYNSYQYKTEAKTEERVKNLKSQAGNLSAQSTDEELEKAAKTFEAYFVEQVMKEMMKTSKIFGNEEDSTMAMTKNMYMDMMYKDMSEQLVEKYGKTFTADMVAQMKRNYGINITPAETDGTDTD